MTEREGISRKMVRNFLIELAIYGVLMAIYFLAVLRILGDALLNLFDNHLITYAVLALALILVQGVVLDFLTSFIMGQLKLDHGD